jgi:hypothetical protein
MSIYRETVTVTTNTAGAGVATGTGRTTKVVEGKVKAVYMDHDASAPASVDLTIAEGNQSPAMPILSVANANTDAWIFPMQQAKDAASGSAITNQGVDVVAADHLLVTIAQANNSQVFAVTIVWDDGQ